MTWKEKLKALGPCPEAYKWACQYSTLRQAWRACERGDWMEWLLYGCDEEDTVRAVLETFHWTDMFHPISELQLQDAYIILDFMPDPPELP